MLGRAGAARGCPQRVLCTPPASDGSANPAVLVAARAVRHRDGVQGRRRAGDRRAWPTARESIPKVDKIFGPGNAWVTAAKQLVASDPAGAALDLPAGPSEVLVIADDAARPELVAADLLAQAEHDTQAQAILVTTSRALAEAVVAAVDAQMRALSRRAILEKSIAAQPLHRRARSRHGDRAWRTTTPPST